MSTVSALVYLGFGITIGWYLRSQQSAWDCPNCEYAGDGDIEYCPHCGSETVEKEYTRIWQVVPFVDIRDCFQYPRIEPWSEENHDYGTFTLYKKDKSRYEYLLRLDGKDVVFNTGDDTESDVGQEAVEIEGKFLGNKSREYLGETGDDARDSDV